MSCVKALSEVTDEEFKAEAKRRGYNIIKIPEKVTLLPCICGSERRTRVFIMRGHEYYTCVKCGLVAKDGKSNREAKLNWNKMIEEMQNGKVNES